MSSDSPSDECSSSSPSSSPSPSSITSSKSSSIDTTTTIQELDRNCFLLRNAVDLDLQQAVFADIMEKSNCTDNTNTTKALYPSPKTIIYDTGKPTMEYDLPLDIYMGGPYDDDGSEGCSIYKRIIKNALVRLDSQVSFQYLREKHATTSNINNKNNNNSTRRKRKHLSVAAIRYPVPNGSFPKHIDHCKDSMVYLLSLGCTSNFVVETPSSSYANGQANNTNINTFAFAFRSGDLLVFDASTEAAVKHGVLDCNYPPESCPKELADRFEILRTHRFGVQCRVTSK